MANVMNTLLRFFKGISDKFREEKCEVWTDLAIPLPFTSFKQSSKSCAFQKKLLR